MISLKTLQATKHHITTGQKAIEKNCCATWSCVESAELLSQIGKKAEVPLLRWLHPNSANPPANQGQIKTNKYCTYIAKCQSKVQQINTTIPTTSTWWFRAAESCRFHGCGTSSSQSCVETLTDSSNSWEPNQKFHSLTGPVRKLDFL